MSRTNHIRLMAAYNEWMNGKVYEAAGKLPSDALKADRGAFFRSILGTLNHLVVADTIWLKRFANHPAGFSQLDPAGKLPTPVALEQILFEDFDALAGHRRMLDEVIKQWVGAVTEGDLDVTLAYVSMKGIPAAKDLFGLMMHFFNHQTHHRGQATTLLSQAGADLGVTDLLALIPDAAEA